MVPNIIDGAELAQTNGLRDNWWSRERKIDFQAHQHRWGVLQR